MPTSTYVSLLVRSHLRLLTPLPTPELVVLKRTVAEIGAIGRNLNQIARAFNQGDRPGGPSREDLHALLRVLDGLRVDIKALINANLASWRSGYEKRRQFFKRDALLRNEFEQIVGPDHFAAAVIEYAFRNILLYPQHRQKGPAGSSQIVGCEGRNPDNLKLLSEASDASRDELAAGRSILLALAAFRQDVLGTVRELF